MSELCSDNLDHNPEHKDDWMVLPTDPNSLKTAALMLQNDLSYERQQRRQLEQKLASLELQAYQGESSEIYQSRFEKQRTHYLEQIQQGKIQLRKSKEQQRKWEADMLHRIEKLKSERSAVTERCLLIERSNVQLQQEISSLQAELVALRLLLTQTEESLVVSTHEFSNHAMLLQSSKQKLASLTEELERERQRCKELLIATARVQHDNIQESESCEKLLEANKREALFKAKLQSLQNEVVRLNAVCKDRDTVVTELRQALNLQRDFTSIQFRSLEDRCDALKNINRLLQNQIMSLQQPIISKSD